MNSFTVRCKDVFYLVLSMSSNLWVSVLQAIEAGTKIIVRSDFDDCGARTDLRFASDSLNALSFLPNAMAQRIVQCMLETVEIGGHEGLPAFYAAFPNLLDEGYSYLKAGQVYELCTLERREKTVLMDGFESFTRALGPVVWVTANHQRNVYAGNRQLGDETTVSRNDLFLTDDKSEGTGPWDLSCTRFPGTSVCLENSRRNALASCNAYPFFLLDVNATDVTFENNIVVIPNWHQNPLELITIAAAM